MARTDNYNQHTLITTSIAIIILIVWELVGELSFGIFAFIALAWLFTEWVLMGVAMDQRKKRTKKKKVN